jgi:hypothetical protein
MLTQSTGWIESMPQAMRNAIAGMRRDIERWEKDLAAAEKAGAPALAGQILGWIINVKKIIADSGY